MNVKKRLFADFFVLLIITIFVSYIFDIAYGDVSEVGDISRVRTASVGPQLYSDEDIESAIEVAEDYFHKHFGGCVMTDIHYGGDEASQREAEYHKEYEGVILLYSDFYTEKQLTVGGLADNSYYPNFNWIIVKKDGKWQHLDHGY